MTTRHPCHPGVTRSVTHVSFDKPRKTTTGDAGDRKALSLHREIGIRCCHPAVQNHISIYGVEKLVTLSPKRQKPRNHAAEGGDRTGDTRVTAPKSVTRRSRTLHPPDELGHSAGRQARQQRHGRHLSKCHRPLRGRRRHEQCSPVSSVGLKRRCRTRSTHPAHPPGELHPDAGRKARQRSLRRSKGRAGTGISSAFVLPLSCRSGSAGMATAESATSSRDRHAPC